MEITFRSKIGLGVFLALAVPLIVGLCFMIAYTNIPGIVIVSMVILFITHLLLTTCYTITNDNSLKIKSGFIINTTIDIAAIKSIRHTRNPLSSPALSLDRLEISYNRFDKIMISPKQQDVFIEHLKHLNPAIRID